MTLRNRLNRLVTRFWALFWVFGAIATIPVRKLVPPPCTRAITGPFDLTLVFNCDSAQFMQDSQDLGRLVRSETSYQDRPLYALLAHLISLPLRSLIPGNRTFSNSEGIKIDFQIANLVSFWVIHVVVIVTAISMILIFINQVEGPNLLTKYTVITLLLVNDLTKSFFWTPHTQLFSLLMVALALYSWKQFQGFVSKRFTFYWFLSLSCLIFLYPILVLTLVIPLVRDWRRYFLPCFLAIVPYLLYPTILTSLGGQYRRTTTEDFNQFVWVLKNDALSQAKHNLVLFIETFSLQYIFVIVLLSTILIFFRARRDKGLTSGLEPVSPIVAFFAAYVVFLYFMGLYAYRLTLPLLAGAVALLTIAISRMCPRGIANAANGLILILCLYSFFFNGMIS